MWGWFGSGQKPTSSSSSRKDGIYSTCQCQLGQDRTCFPLISFPLQRCYDCHIGPDPRFWSKIETGSWRTRQTLLGAKFTAAWFESQTLKLRSRKTEIRIKPALLISMEWSRLTAQVQDCFQTTSNHQETPFKSEPSPPKSHVLCHWGLVLHSVWIFTSQVKLTAKVFLKKSLKQLSSSDCLGTFGTPNLRESRVWKSFLFFAAEWVIALCLDLQAARARPATIQGVPSTSPLWVNPEVSLLMHSWFTALTLVDFQQVWYVYDSWCASDIFCGRRILPLTKNGMSECNRRKRGAGAAVQYGNSQIMSNIQNILKHVTTMCRLWKTHFVYHLPVICPSLRTLYGRIGFRGSGKL